MINKRWPLEIVQEGDGLIVKTDKAEKLLALDETTFYLETDPEAASQFSDLIDGKFQKYTQTHPLYSFSASRTTEG